MRNAGSRNAAARAARQLLADSGVARGLALLVIAFVIASCGGTASSSSAAKKLAAKIITAPFGYKLDTTPGAVGQITPAVFGRYGGDASVKAAFVAGFKAAFRISRRWLRNRMEARCLSRCSTVNRQSRHMAFHIPRSRM